MPCPDREHFDVLKRGSTKALRWAIFTETRNLSKGAPPLAAKTSGPWMRWRARVRRVCVEEIAGEVSVCLSFENRLNTTGD